MKCRLVSYLSGYRSTINAITWYCIAFSLVCCRNDSHDVEQHCSIISFTQKGTPWLCHGTCAFLLQRLLYSLPLCGNECKHRSRSWIVRHDAKEKMQSAALRGISLKGRSSVRVVCRRFVCSATFSFHQDDCMGDSMREASEQKKQSAKQRGTNNQHGMEQPINITWNKQSTFRGTSHQKNVEQTST